MEYRRLGSAGLKVSVLSFGSWVTFKGQLDVDKAVQCMKVALDNGCNFFDNAEAYAEGASEEIMGAAIKKLGLRRGSYVLSTKFFWGLHDGINEENTLNRKYLLEAIDGSLARLKLDHVDLVFCHRPDPYTPLEETVRAMSDIITQGKALYWGTSEWSADQIMAAWQIAERHHLHKPQMEQPQYNLLWRDRVESEYTRLYKEIGLGTTIWSPLAAGFLTGKYSSSTPASKDSRLSQDSYRWLRERHFTEDKHAQVRELQKVALGLDCTLAQLALAWCVKNPNVSTVITGASTPQQAQENFHALTVVPKLTEAIMAEISKIAPLKETVAF